MLWRRFNIPVLKSSYQKYLRKKNVLKAFSWSHVINQNIDCIVADVFLSPFFFLLST